MWYEGVHDGLFKVHYNFSRSKRMQLANRRRLGCSAAPGMNPYVAMHPHTVVYTTVRKEHEMHGQVLLSQTLCV